MDGAGAGAGAKCYGLQYLQCLATKRSPSEFGNLAKHALALHATVRHLQLRLLVPKAAIH